MNIYSFQVGFFAVMVSVMLSGCGATTGPMQDIANDTAVSVNTVQASLDQYVSQLEKDAKSRLAYMAEQRLATASQDQRFQNRMTWLKITGDKKTIALFEGVNEAVLRSRGARQQAEARISEGQKKLREDLEKYQSQSKTLTQLSEYLGALGKKPDPKQRLLFLTEFLGEVRTELECLNEAAKKAQKESEETPGAGGNIAGTPQGDADAGADMAAENDEGSQAALKDPCSARQKDDQS